MENLTYLLIIDQNDVDDFNAYYKEKHPNSKKQLITSPQHPSINVYSRMHYQAANNLKQLWCDFIVWVLSEVKMTNKNIQKCRLTYRTFFKQTRRRDLDNLSPKYILDGFVKAGLIIDDSSDNIVSLTTECGVDKENPRIEFVIEVIE